jgi:hypothetical protein
LSYLPTSSPPPPPRRVANANGRSVATFVFRSFKILPLGCRYSTSHSTKVCVGQGHVSLKKHKRFADGPWRWNRRHIMWQSKATPVKYYSDELHISDPPPPPTRSSLTDTSRDLRHSWETHPYLMYLPCLIYILNVGDFFLPNEARGVGLASLCRDT